METVSKLTSDVSHGSNWTRVNAYERAHLARLSLVLETVVAFITLNQ